MKSVQVYLKSEIPKTFRTQKAADSVDLDIEKKSEHNLLIENIDLETPFKIGLIIGPSGSGKSTLAEKLFGEKCFDTILDLSRPVIEQFPKEFTYDQCVEYLNGIGLTQVPCWIRPAHTLSNGQRVRAEAALQMASDREFIVLDEWTSVVDRTIAKVMSHCILKFAKRNNKRVVLCSCHFDIIEWIEPDWVIDCAEQKYTNYRGSLWQRQERLEFTVKPATSAGWKYFSKYHYLSDKLPGGRKYIYGLYDQDRQIGFICFANYSIQNKQMYHSNRIVVHPDYCGFGLGGRLNDITSEYVHKTYGLRIRIKFSSLSMLKHLSKNKRWAITDQSMNIYNSKTGRHGQRMNVRSYTFEFMG